MHTLDPLGLLTLGTAPGRVVVVSQPCVDGLGWVGGPQLKGFLPFTPWMVGVVAVGMWGCKRTRVILSALPWEGLVLEAGYRCGKGDLVCKMLHFSPTPPFSLAFSQVVNQFS